MHFTLESRAGEIGRAREVCTVEIRLTDELDVSELCLPSSPERGPGEPDAETGL